MVRRGREEGNSERRGFRYRSRRMGGASRPPFALRRRRGRRFAAENTRTAFGRHGGRVPGVGAWSDGFDETAAAPGLTAEHENARKPASRDTKGVEGRSTTEDTEWFRVRRRRLSCLFVFSPAGEAKTSEPFSVRRRRFPCAQWQRPTARAGTDSRATPFEVARRRRMRIHCVINLAGAACAAIAWDAPDDETVAIRRLRRKCAILCEIRVSAWKSDNRTSCLK